MKIYVKGEKIKFSSNFVFYHNFKSVTSKLKEGTIFKVLLLLQYLNCLLWIFFYWENAFSEFSFTKEQLLTLITININLYIMLLLNFSNFFEKSR